MQYKKRSNACIQFPECMANSKMLPDDFDEDVSRNAQLSMSSFSQNGSVEQTTGCKANFEIFTWQPTEMI